MNIQYVSCKGLRVVSYLRLDRLGLPLVEGEHFVLWYKEDGVSKSEIGRVITSVPLPVRSCDSQPAR